MSEAKDGHFGANVEFPVRRPTADRMNGEAGKAEASQAGVRPQVPPVAPSGGATSVAPQVQAQAPSRGAVPQKKTVGIRKIHMTISKIDVMSALKLGFLLSVAFAVMTVIATAIVWFVLDSMHVFSEINSLLTTLGSEHLLMLVQYLEFGRWLSFGVIIAIFNIVIITALSVIGALVYNFVAALVGGQRIVVTDE